MAYRNSLKLALLGAASLTACSTMAPTNSSGVSADVFALHQRLMTLDTHLDTPAFFDTAHGYDIMKRHSYERDGTQVDYPRMIEGGLDGGFWAIYMGQGPLTPEGYQQVRDKALIRATSIHKMVAANPDVFEIALTSSDAARINAAGKKIVYLSMENSYELGDDLSLLDSFYKLGVRMAGPVHNGTNQLADSTNPGPVGAKWGGLSPMGRDYVKRANALGIILDGSHSADTTIEQMIDLSATPIILSHHGCDGVFEHPRNLPDALLKKLAAKGGVIHMNALGSFLKVLPQSKERTDALTALRTKWGNPNDLSGEKYEQYLDESNAIDKQFPESRATFEDYMEQILYAIKLVGVDHVGFGADWDGGGGVEGYDDVTMLPKVTDRLLKAGYTEADLQKMWGGNVIRLLKAAEDYKAGLAK
ncbi:MAG: dipeptidase [Hyphomonadaceae bacterium]|nr:dipeptidase [Hyphomonadaceae bacterium]